MILYRAKLLISTTYSGPKPRIRYAYATNIRKQNAQIANSEGVDTI